MMGQTGTMDKSNTHGATFGDEMPRPKASPSSYRDVIPMLQFAKRSGGARFNCGTLANAIRTVQRMNQFRIVDRRINYDVHKK
jgi:hypothetical protein